MSLELLETRLSPSITILPSSLPNWTANFASFGQTITATGGTGALTFSSSGTLPPGLVLSTTGVLSGTPTTSGTYTFTVTATDSVQATGSQSYTVTIYPQLAITTTTLPNWTANFGGFSQTISATGGAGPVTFGLSSGSLPPGLTLSSSGVLSGTPTGPGTYAFTVTTTDSGQLPSYTTLDVDDPSAAPGTTRAEGISGSNIVGFYYDSYNKAHGFLYNGSSFTTLDDPSATLGYTYAAGISGSTVVGAYDDSNGVEHGFLYNGSTWTTLDDPSATIITGAVGISGGIIVGDYYDMIGNHGFLYNGSTYTTLDFPGATPGSTYVTGISGSTIAGYYYIYGHGVHGFLYNGSTYSTLDEPGAAVTYVDGISGSNIVGTTEAHGFLYNGSTWTALDDPSAIIGTSPLGMSGSNIVGFYLSNRSPRGYHGFLAKLSTFSQSYTMTINPTVAIAPPSLSIGALDVAGYSQSIAVTGGTGSVTLALTSGALPPGLTLSTTGVLSGTPTAPGPYTFTITASDSVGSSASERYTLIISGPFAQFLITPQITGTTVVAGSSFLVQVQAADQYGNPLASYSGPNTVTLSLAPTSSSSSLPTTVAMDSSGVGYALATLDKVGTYTITAAGGSYAGSTLSPVTVVSAPPVVLSFVSEPMNTPTGVQMSLTVAVQDPYGNLVSGDNSDAVTVSVASGTGDFVDGSTTTVTAASGLAVFNNLILAAPGAYTLSAIVPGKYTGPFSSAFTIAPLQVLPASFVYSASGFSVTLNAPYLVNSVTPALYGSGSGAGATVTLTQTSGTPPGGAALPYQVPGSLVLNPKANTLTFVETDTASVINNGTPLLPDGVYVVHITSSGANGLQALNSGGGYLDGTNAGTPGHDFTATFTVGAAAAGGDVLWVPATADGPGQPLSAPGMNRVGGGYPVYLDDTTGKVTDVQATLTYDPGLLTVSPSTSPTLTVAVPIPGMALVHYRGPALAAGTQTPIGFLTATVPAGTAASPIPYKAKDLLVLSGVSLNGGMVPAVGGQAVHLVAYVGDADGNGSYSSSDALLITRVTLQTDTGFAAYPLVDPVLVADITGSGFIPADAALQVNEAGVGVPAPNLPVPPIPSGVHFQAIIVRHLLPSASTASAAIPIVDAGALDDVFAQAAMDSVLGKHRRSPNHRIPSLPSSESL